MPYKIKMLPHFELACSINTKQLLAVSFELHRRWEDDALLINKREHEQVLAPDGCK